MPPSTDQDTMTLAGLAAANGPWLGVRLSRLAEHTGLPLPREVVEGAVESTSRVLAEITNAEGRPAANASETTDPAVALGREQAKAHQQAGLPLAASLKVQRLLRRAYDDLVRESWVEHDSRARAHEDVERFFERALAGLVSAWTGQVSQPATATDDARTKLIAQREDELRRALEAGHRLTMVVRQTRARADEALAELALAKEQEQTKDTERESLRSQLAQLKDQSGQSASSLRAEFAQALAQTQANAQAEKQALNSRIRDMEEERAVLGGRLADMEMALAAHGDAENARIEAQQELERAHAEADRAREKAENAREELQKLQQDAQDLRRQAEQKAHGALAQTEALRAELHTLRESHAALASEAEAMRARLAETGSRLSEMRHAEEQEIQDRLDRAADAQAQAQARIAELEEAAERTTRESQAALAGMEERLAREAEAAAQARQELAAMAQAKAQAEAQAKKDTAAHIQELEAQRAALASERDSLKAQAADSGGLLARAQQQLAHTAAERDKALAMAQAEAQALRTQRDDLAARLKDAEARVIVQTEELARTKVELLNARATGEDAGVQAQRLDAERGDLVARLKDAESQVITLSDNLNHVQGKLIEARAANESASAQTKSVNAERMDLAARLKDAEGQVIALTEDLTRTQAELAQARAANESASAQAKSASAERMDLAARLKDAEGQVIALTEDLARTRDALADADAKRQQAERRGTEAVTRAGEVLEEAKAQAKARLDELNMARETCTRLLAAHLALTPDAVAALDAGGAFTAWNKRFPALFGLTDENLSTDINAVLPLLAASIQRPEAFLARVQELLSKPALAEDGLELATVHGETLVFRSVATRSTTGAGGRLLSFRNMSLEHDMENLVRQIEGITRYELGHALTAFIHLPQELLDDPATSPAQAKKLTLIRDSGYRIVNTVNMAVDIFRMERGLYKMPPGRTLDLAVVARRAAKDVAQLAASRHVDLELLLDQSPLPQDCVLPGPGDAILAHALVVNLLRDALEAAPRQSAVCAVLHSDNAGLHLDITRQGALAVDEAACYFDKPLGQDGADGLRRARYASQLITKSLGGALSFASTPQTGSTFSLLLPNS